MPDIAFQCARAACTGAAAFVGYCLVLRGCALAAGPLRMALARDGEEALASAGDGREAGDIAFCLGAAHDGWVAALAAAMIPPTALWIGARWALGRPTPAAGGAGGRTIRRFAASAAAANPAMGALAAAELAVAGALLAALTLDLGAPQRLLAAVLRAEAGVAKAIGRLARNG